MFVVVSSYYDSLYSKTKYLNGQSFPLYAAIKILGISLNNLYSKSKQGLTARTFLTQTFLFDKYFFDTNLKM